MNTKQPVGGGVSGLAVERETAATSRQVQRRKTFPRSTAVQQVLALQRAAGNHAVASMLGIQRCACGGRGHGAEEECEDCRARRLTREPAAPYLSTSSPLLQRLTSEEKQQDLTSAKLAPNERLQRAFDNSPAVHIGESGD